jgi:catechol 2,3-dioxygenase-like lactoylglutathione lyase family enzyme
VADVAAAKRFYETIAPHAGLRLEQDMRERVQFAGTSGSLSLTRGSPTENLHVAFPTDDDGDVRRFHQAATDAGYRSKGSPGERRSTTRATTPRMSSIQTATTSRSSTTTAASR